MPRITAEQNEWRTGAILSHSVPTVEPRDPERIDGGEISRHRN